MKKLNDLKLIETCKQVFMVSPTVIKQKHIKKKRKVEKNSIFLYQSTNYRVSVKNLIFLKNMFFFEYVLNFLHFEENLMKILVYINILMLFHNEFMHTRKLTVMHTVIPCSDMYYKIKCLFNA